MLSGRGAGGASGPGRSVRERGQRDELALTAIGRVPVGTPANAVPYLLKVSSVHRRRYPPRKE